MLLLGYFKTLFAVYLEHDTIVSSLVAGRF